MPSAHSLKNCCKRPVQIEVDPPNSAAKSVKQWIYEVDKSKKPDLLCQLLRNNDWQQVLVFTRTRIDADRLVQKLANNGISALAIHGDKSQGIRARALAAFKANTIRVSGCHGYRLAWHRYQRTFSRYQC